MLRLEAEHPPEIRIIAIEAEIPNLLKFLSKFIFIGGINKETSGRRILELERASIDKTLFSNSEFSMRF